MAKLFDRVKVNVPTTGTGDIEFGAAVSTAFLTPVEAGALDGNEVRYVIVDGLDFEEGLGLIKDTVATMERTVTKSKIGGTVGTSKINLSGTAVLALTASAADIMTQAMGLHADANLADVEDAAAALTNLGGTTVGKAVFTAADAAAARTAIGADDPWSQQPIGVPIPLLDSLTGTSAPPTDQGYRYIKLTASDSYNTGVLTSESVSGSAPLVVATAVISLAGSPINGQTVNLINTERRFLRAGSAGTVENDQMQQITGGVGVNLHASTVAPMLIAQTGAFSIGPAVNSNQATSAAGSSIADGFTFDSANSPNARAGTETRGKNIGVTYFMRIK